MADWGWFFRPNGLHHEVRAVADVRSRAEKTAASVMANSIKPNGRSIAGYGSLPPTTASRGFNNLTDKPIISVAALIGCSV